MKNFKIVLTLENRRKMETCRTHRKRKTGKSGNPGNVAMCGGGGVKLILKNMASGGWWVEDNVATPTQYFYALGVLQIEPLS